MNIAGLFHPESELVQEAHDLLAKISGLSHKIRPPKVSVIIPTYNRPEFLSEALKGVFSQTYKDIEVIVVNDGGTDVEHLTSSLHKSGKIIYIKCDEHRGPSAARNTGIKAAHGKYIAYLDDDDIYYPDHIETLVNFLENSKHKVAYTDAYRVHIEKENDRYIVKKKDIPYSFDFDPDLILVQNFFPTLTVMHEKSCIDEIGLFDESLGTHEDWDLWIRMSRRFEFAHIKKVTCEYTRSRDGASATYEKRKDFSRTQKVIHQRYSIYLKDKPWLLATQEKHREITYVQNCIDHRVVPISIKARPETIHNKISVVAPLKEGSDRLRLFLAKIRSQKKIQDIEIIIIGSVVTDYSLEITREYGAKVIHIPENEFECRTIYKIGTKEAGGEFLVFTVQDAIPINDYWLYNMISPFLEYPQLSAVSVKQFVRPDADLFGLWIAEEIEKSVDLERDYFIFSSRDTGDINPIYFRSQTKERLRFFNNVVSCFRRRAVEGIADSIISSLDSDIAASLLRRGEAVGYLSSTGVYHWCETGAADIFRQHYRDTKDSGKVTLFFYYSHQIELKTLLMNIISTYDLINVSLAMVESVEDDPVLGTRSFLNNIRKNMEDTGNIAKTIKGEKYRSDDGLELLLNEIAGEIAPPAEQKFNFKKDLIISDFLKKVRKFTEYLHAKKLSLKGGEEDFSSCICKIFSQVAGEALGVYYLENEALNTLSDELIRIDALLTNEVCHN